MEIVYLADHLHYIPQLAKWHHGQWGHLNSAITLADREAGLRRKAAHRQIPTTLIAIEGDQQRLCGSASIVENDLTTRPELTPWLASVFVSPDFRNQGIGSAIVKRVMSEAMFLQIDPLYLITPNKQNFYRRLGWQPVEDVTYRNEQVTIMEWSP